MGLYQLSTLRGRKDMETEDHGETDAPSSTHLSATWAYGDPVVATGRGQSGPSNK